MLTMLDNINVYQKPIENMGEVSDWWSKLKAMSTRILSAYILENTQKSGAVNACLYSSVKRCRKIWKSPIKSLSFFLKAAVMADLILSELEPGPQFWTELIHINSSSLSL